MTTAVSWFGLVTVSTVSWPVVAIGGALAGTGIATGAINTARLRDKAEARLRVKARAHIAAALIRGTRKHPALLEQVTQTLAIAASQAKEL